MDSLLVLVPATLLLGLLALAFLWALRNGQYDDPDEAAVIQNPPPRFVCFVCFVIRWNLDFSTSC